MTCEPEFQILKKRFNLRVLQHAPNSLVPKDLGPTFRISRRSFLGLSAAVTVQQLLQKVPTDEDFSIVRDGAVLHVALDSKYHWTIDPDIFGPQATVGWTRTPDAVKITLRNGFFPGTRVRADFSAVLRKTAGVWKICIRFLQGTTFRSELLPWLRRRDVAVADRTASWIRWIPGLQLRTPLKARLQFTPDWTWRIPDRLEANLTVSGQTFVADGASIQVLSAGVGETLAECHGHRTVVKLEKGNHPWPIHLGQKSDVGWELNHTEELFDTAYIEALTCGDEPIHTALFTAAGSPTPALRFAPGGGLLNSMREPAQILLQQPRMLLDLANGSSALSADLAETSTWLHGSKFSVEVGSREGGTEFQLFRSSLAEGDQSTPVMQPRIGCVCASAASGSILRLEPGGKLTSHWTWSNIIQPVERALGALHISFWEDHLRFDLADRDRFRLLRSFDQLSLSFACENMQLHLPFLGQPTIQRKNKDREATITAIFPPQHVTEESFFTKYPVAPGYLPVGPVEKKNGAITSDQLDPDTTHSEELRARWNSSDPTIPRTKAAGPSQLVFTITHQKIPFTIDGLLDWSGWCPKLAEAAKIDAKTPVPVNPVIYPISDAAGSHPAQKDNHATGIDRYTAIELPWRLYLSPSERETWQHERVAVDYETGVYELWHSRLGLVQPLTDPAQSHAVQVTDVNTADVPITKTGLTARAIWSDDFTGLTYNLGDHYPTDTTPGFRTTLDVRDRQEIVHLTSNRRWLEPIDIKNRPPGAHPIDVEHLMLTPMGGYLRSFGAWNPGKLDDKAKDFRRQLTVEQWRHITTLARDQYVRVVYKGYLLPFGHRASLVKVTERRFVSHPETNVVYAVLQQHMYITVGKKDRDYPLLGQPWSGRNLGFDRIEALTLRTPNLQDPSKQIRPDEGDLQSQSLFWPCVLPGEPFRFDFRFHHKDGTYSDSLTPVAFVGANLAQNIKCAKDAVSFYNYGCTVNASPPTESNPDQPSLVKFGFCVPVETLTGKIEFTVGNGPEHVVNIAAGTKLTAIVSKLNRLGAGVTARKTDDGELIVTGPSAAGSDLNFKGTQLTQSAGRRYVISNPWRRSDFHSKKVEFAPSLKSGDTEFDTDSIHWRVVMSVKARSAGSTDLANQLYLADLPYFHPVLHQASITSASSKRIARATKPTTVSFYPTYVERGFDRKYNRGEVFLQVIDEVQELSFGGRNQAVDKSGGIVNPDILVVGFSRATGPVGGRRSDADTAAFYLAESLKPPAVGGRLIATTSAGTAISSQSSLSVHANGSFDPMSFFGGLASARILGGLKLSDVVSPLLNAIASELGKAPQMLEQLLYEDIQLDDLEKKLVGLIDDVQQLYFSPAADAPVQFPFRRRLASQAQAVDNVYALRVASEKGQDAIAITLAHAQVISAIIQYAEALEKLVSNPVQFAEDIFLDALVTFLGDKYKQLVSGLNDSADALFRSIQAESLTALNVLAGKLKAYADFVLKEYADPILKDEAPIKTVFRQMEPELAAVLEIAPVVDDLAGRIQNMKDYSDPIRKIENIPPALDDALKIAERLGVLDAVQTQPMLDAAAAVEKVAVNTYKVAVDLNKSPIQKIIGASWVFAEELSKYTPNPSVDTTVWIDRGRQVLQAAAQLRQSVTQLGQALKFRPETNSSLRDWACTQFRRRMQSNVLAALQTVHTSALGCLRQVAKGTPLETAATDLLNSFGDATQANWLDSVLTTVADLNTLANKVEDVRKHTKAVLDAEQQLLILAYQNSQTLSNEIGDLRAGNLPAFENANQILAAQARLFLKTLELQAPFAVAQAYGFYSTANNELRDLQSAASTFIKWFNTIAQPACNALATLYGKWKNLNNFITSVTGTEMVLFKVIESQLAVVGDSFDAYEKAVLASPLSPGCPISPSQAVYHLNQTIAAVNALVQATQQGVSNLRDAGKEVVETAKQVLSRLQGMIPHAVKVRLSFDWRPKLKSFEPVFLLRANADLTIQAEAIVPISRTGPQPSPSFKTVGTIKNFSINLIGRPSFIIIDINSFKFTASSGNRPDVQLTIDKVRFGDQMQFVAEIASLLNPQNGPFLDFVEGAVSAGFRFHVPNVQVGTFSMMQLSLNVAVKLPFNGDPVRCIFGVSEQDQPFLLAVSIFGGGGFLQLRLGLDGVEMLEGALEFGLVAGISIGPLNGWGYVVAGIYFRLEASKSRVGGFVHAHGHMDVLGIVSMDIDLKVTTYYLSGGIVQGDADFEVDIDILFFSASYTFHATYQFQGHRDGSQMMLAAADSHLMSARATRPCTVPAIDPDQELTQEIWNDYLKRFSFAASLS